jgi:hypothetical protein
MTFARRRRNWIESMLIHGETFLGREEVGRVAVDYLRELLGGASKVAGGGQGENVQSITEAQVGELTNGFSEDEVRRAVWSLNAEGCLGPDGFPVFFFKEFWSLVGVNVMQMMEEFGRKNKGFDKLNIYYLFLLPKKEGAEIIQNFRLIALSNAMYLLVAKVLANMLKDLLGDLVSPVRTAFIPRRGILHGFVVDMEALAIWRREKK